MEPKDKAKELVDKFSNEILLTINGGKVAALIAVDEILNNDNNLFNTYSQNDYWLQVKQEIEKL
jgi:ABC-type arginine/histidine transport system permease subunit